MDIQYSVFHCTSKKFQNHDWPNFCRSGILSGHKCGSIWWQLPPKRSIAHGHDLPSRCRSLQNQVNPLHFLSMLLPWFGRRSRGLRLAYPWLISTCWAVLQAFTYSLVLMSCFKIKPRSVPNLYRQTQQSAARLRRMEVNLQQWMPKQVKLFFIFCAL